MLAIAIVIGLMSVRGDDGKYGDAGHNQNIPPGRIVSSHAVVDKVDPVKCKGLDSTCKKYEIISVRYDIGPGNVEYTFSRKVKKGKYRLGQQLTNVYYDPTYPGQVSLKYQ